MRSLQQIVNARAERLRRNPVEIHTQAVIQPPEHQDHCQSDFRVLEDCVVDGRVWSPALGCWVLEGDIAGRKTVSYSSRISRRGKSRYRVYCRDLILTEDLWASNDDLAVVVALAWCQSEGHDDRHIRIRRV